MVRNGNSFCFHLLALEPHLYWICTGSMFTVGLGSRGIHLDHESYVACWAPRNKVLCVWFRSTMPWTSIHKTEADLPISMRVKSHPLTVPYSAYVQHCSVLEFQIHMEEHCAFCHPQPFASCCITFPWSARLISVQLKENHNTQYVSFKSPCIMVNSHCQLDWIWNRHDNSEQVYEAV